MEFEKTSHIWGKNEDRSDILIMKDIDFSRSVYPFIPVPKILRRSEEYIRSMLTHVYELKMYSGRETRDQYITCKLCNKQFEIVSDLRLHLISKLHKDLEQVLKTIAVNSSCIDFENHFI